MARNILLSTLCSNLGIPEYMPATYSLPWTKTTVATEPWGDGSNKRYDISARVRVIVRSVPGRSHRVQVECPGCKAVVSFGRFHQHYNTARCWEAHRATLPPAPQAATQKQA